MMNESNQPSAEAGASGLVIPQPSTSDGGHSRMDALERLFPAQPRPLAINLVRRNGHDR